MLIEPARPTGLTMKLDSSLIYTVLAHGKVVGYNVRGIPASAEAYKRYLNSPHGESPQRWLVFEQLLRRDHNFSSAIDGGTIGIGPGGGYFKYEAQ